MKSITLSKIGISLASLIFLASCGGESDSSKEQEEQKTQSLIFGQFAGMCVGENCVDTFKISGGKVYEDTIDDYNHESFNFKLLGEDKYQQVKGFINQVPIDVLSTYDSTIGCPDCADGGGWYVQVDKDGKSQRWLIDTDLTKVPNDLHTFVNTLQLNVAILQNEASNVCPTVYQPLCAKVKENDKSIFKNYGNQCYLDGDKNIEVISVTSGECPQ